MTVYYDGLCNLCDSFVRFILARDRRARYRFAPLQGETARARLPGSLTQEELKTVVLEENGRWRFRSDAALAIMAGLGGLWKMLAVFRLVPRPFRDRLYDYVARKRFQWFGRRDACRVPTAEERARFL
ncbi:MAG: thiol-disulfide oxidoreductase DCC family protein, partial [Gemmatimonadales bacterium]